MALLDARAARIAKELDVEQLDLMPILERSLNTYYDWLHLSPGGARAVAAAVAAAVLRQPLPAARVPDRPGAVFGFERSNTLTRPTRLTAVVSGNGSRDNGDRESPC